MVKSKVDLLYLTLDGIISIREQETPIGSNTAIRIGKEILLKHKKSSLHEFSRLIALEKDWAIRTYVRMCFMANAMYKEKRQFKSKVLH